MDVVAMGISSTLAYLVSKFPHTSECIVQWMTFFSDESLQNSVDKGSILVGCLPVLVLLVNDYLYFIRDRHEGRVHDPHPTSGNDVIQSLQYLWMFEKVYRLCLAIPVVGQAPSYQAMIWVAMDLLFEIVMVAIAEVMCIFAIFLMSIIMMELRSLLLL